MNVAQIKNCTNRILECKIIADETTGYCINSTTHIINYQYQTCDRDSVAQVNHASYSECLCIKNPFTECEADFLNQRCTNIFLTISSIDTFIGVLGMILNLLVCVIYYRRGATQNKLPNILFVNQAFADLFTCTIYILPNTVFLFIFTVNKTRKYHNFHEPIHEFPAFVSICSSVLIYTVAVFERWLSIAKPIWHHVNVKTKHIWRAVMVSWLISLGMSLQAIFVDETPAETYAIYYKAMQGIMVVFMAAITILFITTWYTALVEVRRHRQLRSDSNRVKTELRITKIFAIMYTLFVMAFIPLATIHQNIMSPVRRIKILLFTLSAMVNPMLTLTLRRDYKICQRQSVWNGGV